MESQRLAHLASFLVIAVGFCLQQLQQYCYSQVLKVHATVEVLEVAQRAIVIYMG